MPQVNPPPPVGFAAPFPTGELEVDAHGTVQIDAPCRKCSYSLRGLNINGRCPECGTPIGVSIQGNFLAFSYPEWIENLRRGVSLVLWGVLLLIVTAIAAVLLSRVILPILGHLIVLTASLVGLYGAWLLTEPDPSGIGEDQYGQARKIIRLSLVASVVESMVELVQTAVSTPPSVRMLLETLVFMLGLIGVVGLVALLHYLSWLALRIPDEVMAVRARFLRYALAVSLGITLVMSFIMNMLPATSQRPGHIAANCFLMIAGLATLVFYVMYLFLLGRMGRAFREQAQLARSYWAADQEAGSAATSA